MVFVFLAEGFEEIEALAVVDVLRRAGQQVRTVGVGAMTVTGAHGIPVVCDMDAEDVIPEQISMLVLPGGMPGTRNLDACAKVHDCIDFAAANNRWIAAICAAPSVLGRKGLLRGRRAVCFPGFEDQLEGALLSQDSVCVDGHYVTARGMGVAVDFALELAALLTDRKQAQALRETIQCEK